MKRSRLGDIGSRVLDRGKLETNLIRMVDRRLGLS